MVNRNWDHGDAAIRSIKDDFGVDAPIEWIHCDLGNLDEVRKVFCTIRQKEERLDIVRLCYSWMPLYLTIFTVGALGRDQCEQGK
jgi:hypothetical protein